MWQPRSPAVARAAQGVLQTLDKVPAEGDWPEGINYWFCTLMMGLRFARALRSCIARPTRQRAAASGGVPG